MADIQKSESILNTEFSINNLWAVDDFGRTISPIINTKQNRYVGIFYFPWYGQHPTEQSGVYDITKLLDSNPSALWNSEGTPESPLNTYHYWGEPLFGYYNSEDEWIIHKHIQLLTYASIDFLAFDVSNAYTYDNVCIKMLDILQQYIDKGWNVPKIAFYTFADSGNVMAHLYNVLYKEEKYKDLWFTYENKPLIIGKAEEASEEIKNFFYLKSAQWPDEPSKSDGFPWMDWKRPQTLYGNVMSVSVAQHPALPFSDSVQFDQPDNWGRGYHDEKNDKEEIRKGANFQEQWDNAIAADPEIVFITSWNEWTAVKFVGNPFDRFGERVFFVDSVNEEFSRDVELMKGGYEDSFYLQMIQNIRRYKGVQGSNLKPVQKTINIEIGISQWDEITNIYRNFDIDDSKRDSSGIHPSIIYKNDTVRNDIQEIRITHDNLNVYFLINARNDITNPSSLENWCNILIGTENNKVNFAGFDYIINRHVDQNNSTSIEKSTGGYNFNKIADAKYNLSGNILQVEISRLALGLEDHVKFYFKIADNVQNPSDILDYYVTGECVPLGRLSFTYSE